MASYFSGTRQLDPFLITDGDDRLACTISEYWSNMDQDITVMCGATEESETERTIGIARKDIHSLDAILTGSLGVKGLASLGSELRERVGSEIEMKESSSRKTKYKVTAPKCGSTSYVFYQLIRIFEFKVPRSRPWPFKACVSTHTFVEKTRNFAIRAETIDHDPQCGCGTARPITLRLVDFFIGNLKLRTDAIVGDDGSITSNIGGLNVHINVETSQFTLDLRNAPEFLIDLAGWSEAPIGVATFSFPPPQETETPELFGLPAATSLGAVPI